MGERGEQRLVQTLVAQAAEEGFCKSILLRLARRDVVPLNPHFLRPAQDRAAGQFGAVGGHDRGRSPTDGDDRIKFAHDP